MSNVLGLMGLLRLVARATPLRPAVAGPLPTERHALVRPDEVDRHRALGCASYESCLDSAYRQGWKSWSCQRCPRFTVRGQRVGRALIRLARQRAPLRLVPSP